MFTVEERAQLRADLIADARKDHRITGGAITGSASVGRDDRWSDIDLAFGVRAANEIPATLADWTARMLDRHGALDHFDLTVGAWVYRVFFLPNTLQVDIAFAPANEFGARAPTFKLVFGAAAEAVPVPPPVARRMICWGWLYAIHARSCIARKKWWQAEYMISGIRDQVLALACVRHALPASEGRGIDALPREVLAPLEAALVRGPTHDELTGALRAAVDGLLRETAFVDPSLASRIDPAMRELVETARSASVEVA